MKKILLILFMALFILVFVSASECPFCHEKNGYALSTWIDSYSATGHIVASGWSHCPDCNKDWGGTKVSAPHALQYGSWSDFGNNTNHVQTVRCTTSYYNSCGYSTQNFAAHTYQPVNNSLYIETRR